MPFNNEFLHNASKPVRVQSVEGDFDNAKKLIEKAIKLASERSHFIDPKEVDIYIHGSYALETNIYFPSNLEIMVELKKTPDYDPGKTQYKKYRLYNNYFVDTTCEFNPVDFSKALYEALAEVTGGNLSQSEKFIELPRQKGIRHTLEVTPCFSFNYVEQSIPLRLDADSIAPNFFKDAQTFRGVILFDHSVGKHIFTFPKLHARNGQAKNLATNGNFLKIVRLFKTLNKIGERELDFDKTRGYFINCLLFNVPNDLFIVRNFGGAKTNPLIASGYANDDPSLHKIFLRVLNFLLNTDFENFVSQNMIWMLFGAADEFWKIHDAHEFVKDMKELYDNFPIDRKLLAL